MLKTVSLLKLTLRIRAVSIVTLAALLFSFDIHADPAFPLKVAADGRHLVDQTNTPFLVNGDSPWSLITGVTQTEAEQYLEDRRQRGFNAVLVNLIEHYFNGPATQDGQEPFLVTGDFSTPNEAYFAHADWVISRAAQKGIVVFLTPAYLGYACGNEGWCQDMIANGPDKMRNYGRYIGARYRSFPNIVWVAGGDTDAHATPGANEVNEAMLQGILEQDNQHLMTAHCNRENSGIDCYNTTWLKVNTTYSECTGTPSHLKTDFNRSPAMPFVFIEGRYEGESATPVCVRSQAYWSVLAGANGHFYGDNPIWLFGSGWQNALGAPGGASLIHLRDLFQSRSWNLLVPDFSHTAVTAGYGDIGGSSYAGVALTSDRQTLIAYLPTQRSVTVDLTRISGNTSKVWWFNPTTGTSQLVGEIPDMTNYSVTSPSSGDWILVVDDASANLPAPGGNSTVPNPPRNVTVE